MSNTKLIVELKELHTQSITKRNNSMELYNKLLIQLNSPKHKNLMKNPKVKQILKEMQDNIQEMDRNIPQTINYDELKESEIPLLIKSIQGYITAINSCITTVSNLLLKLY